ncbi:hypothetical protein [Rhizobium skierniewicense]|uniref:hypothetical protein n=1 Tax=Rhizobium skierniewicense TaxID=984260 RepID=UPI0015722DB3|nr:hypothetical protein [Rhizobium skierniewicense]NTF32309.1 hypothetical protein [Rhizobium skierniewicense]
MVDWQAARAFTEAACAKIFDYTPCRLVARTTGPTVNHLEQDDPTRAAFDFLGTIDLEATTEMIRRYPSADPNSGNGVVSYDAVLSADINSWPWLPSIGDRVVTASKTWRVEASRKDGSSRPAWFLSEVKHVIR